MEWWKNPLRAVTLEFPASDVATIDVTGIVNETHRGAVNTLCVFTTGYYPGGMAFYQSKICPHHPGLGQRDLLKEAITAAHRNGQKVIAYIASIWGGRALYDAHPDWAQRKADGSLNAWDEELNSLAMCPHSPYRGYLSSVVHEVSENYEVDGFYFDEPSFQSWCACEHCQAKFRQETGCELPTVENWDDPVFRQFIQWRYRSIAAWRHELYSLGKRPSRCVFFQGAFPLATLSLKPIQFANFQFVNPYAERFMVEWQVPTAHGDDMPATASIGDVVHFELYRRAIHEPLWWYGVALRYGMTIGKGKQVLALNMMAQTPFDLYGLPERELRVSIGEVLANGGAPLFARYYPDRVDQPAWNAVYAELKRVQVLDPYLVDRSSLKYAAVLFSRDSMDRFDYTYGKPPHLGCLKGFAVALLRNQILFDVITEEELSRLDEYQVLVLPNARCLSQKAKEAIAAYVCRGGGLAASYESGLYDETGTPTPENTLADVLGIHYTSEEQPWRGFDVYMRFENELTLPTPCLAGRPVPNGGTQKLVELAGARPEARLLGGSTVHYGPLGDQVGPATLTTYQAGRGRAVYFAFPIGNAYKEFRVPAHGDLMAAAVHWAAQTCPMVELDGAAESLALTAFSQPGGRLVVHLVNSVWDEPVGALEEIPIAPACMLKVNTAAPPKKVFILPSGQIPEWSQIDGRLAIQMPPVEDHITLIVEP